MFFAAERDIYDGALAALALPAQPLDCANDSPAAANSRSHAQVW